MSTEFALTWIRYFLGIAVTLQTLEFFQIQNVMSERGIWRWSILKQDFEEFPQVVVNLFSILLRYPNILFVLVFRLICGFVILVYPHPAAFLFIFASTLLLSIRWRGAFNGGSDSMTLVVSLGCSIAAIFNDKPLVVLGSLWYIAIQSSLSYTLAGLSKAKVSQWWTGQALKSFIGNPRYFIPLPIRRLLSTSTISRLGSWLVILFECSFPCVFINSHLGLIYLGLGALFHMFNYFAFGLNRFFFIWLATYPAIYYCSQQIFS